MLSSMSATDVAFTMAGLLQAVMALIWLLGSWLVGDTRRAAVHWAGYAALSAASFALLTAAFHVQGSPMPDLLRGFGNIAGFLGLIALQRGIWLFVGRPLTTTGHWLAVAAVLVASYIGLSPSDGSIRVGVNSIVQAVLAFGMAYDLRGFARDRLRLRQPSLLALPLLIAAFAFLFRGTRALLAPYSVSSEMAADSGLNVGSALLYVILALAFHATLVSLVVSRLVLELRHRSRHDGLTGLLNRRAMEEALHAQVQRSRRTGEPFTVLMLDLDHFKSINDRFGHAAGDHALRHAATLLKAGVREVDHLARFGGEEFLALMPGASLAAAQPLAERLRGCLDAEPLVLETASVPLSVSIGVAQWADASEDASRLLVRADAALYQAKLEGRNRVVTAVSGLLWPQPAG
jgi:diguanylate cyclase (GGDEF)-like protein